MKRKAHIILLVLLLLCVLSTTAFAIDESEVESAIAASSKEEVAGNVFIWFTSLDKGTQPFVVCDG